MSGTRFRLIGETALTKISNVESVYDELPTRYKDTNNFPNRYYQLTVDQKFFVDSLFEACYSAIMVNPDVNEEIENLCELTAELQTTMNNIKNFLR